MFPLPSSDPSGMIVALDVDYRPDGASAAAVVFRDWNADRPEHHRVVLVPDVADYEPGNFFRRELPCLLRVLAELAPMTTTAPLAPRLDARCLIIDGYVDLAPGRAGLGRHLFEAFGGAVPVIGVAKTRFRDAPAAEVHRGSGSRPLYITAVGMDLAEAASNITKMHGDFRLPTLLKRVDTIAREG